MAAAGRNGRIRVWNITEGKSERDIDTEGRRIRALAFSPDVHHGQRLKLEPACPQAARSTYYDLQVRREGTPAPALIVPRSSLEAT